MNLKKISAKSFWPQLYLPLLLLLCAAYAWRPLEGGFDFWAHAAVGKWIWQHQAVPRETLFLWSEPHTPWVAHSWLSELLFYSLLVQGGPQLVVIFSTVMVVLTFFLLWRVWKREAPFSFWVPLMFALAIWVSAPRFQPRQELISALFLVLILAFLVAWQSGRFDDWLRDKGLLDASLVAVPVVVLFFLWVNLHALVAVGLLVLLAALLGDGAQALIGSDCYDGPARARARVLMAVGVLCVCATLCNPYGLAYWTAANQLKPENMAKVIEEWKPLWAYPSMFDYAAVQTILFGFALLTWLSNPQRRWTHFLWLLLATLLTMHSRRMLWLAAIIFLVVMAANARYFTTPTLWRKWRKLIGGDQQEPIPVGMRVVAQVGAALVLLAWALTAASRHTPEVAGNWNVYVRNVPEGAARFLNRQPASLRVLNDYEDSSYFQWRLNGAPREMMSTRGRRPLYIDLLNAYPDWVMFEYLDMLNANERGLRRLNARKIDCIVLGEHHWKKPLVKYLDNNKAQWKWVWGDKQSKIWVRRNIDVS